MSNPPRKGQFENPELKLIGQEAERIAYDFLRSQIQVPIEDLRDVDEWRQKEVDFRFTTQTGVTYLIEVKSDRHIGSSGNVLFEVARVHHTTKNPKKCVYLGWSVFSESDRVFVWCPPNRQLYIFWTDDLRRAMQGYVNDKRKGIRVSVVDTDSDRTTLNILIPLSYLAHRIYQKVGREWRQVVFLKAQAGLHAKEMAA